MQKTGYYIMPKKSAYHTHGIFFPYDHEIVGFIKQIIQPTFGWKQISFVDQDGEKFWATSSPEVMRLLWDKYPQFQKFDSGLIEEVRQIPDKKKKEVSVAQVEESIKKKIEADTHLFEESERIKKQETTEFFVPGMKKKLFPYQNVGVEFLTKTNGRAMLADEMGCISGDAVVIVNRAKGARKYTMRDLFVKFNNPQTNRYHWDEQIDTNTRSLTADGVFKLGKIKKVLFKGVKSVVRVKAKTESGKLYEIELTADHQIATINGWVEAGKLKINDTIIVNGSVVRWCDVCKKNMPHSGESAKYAGECRSCIYRLRRKNTKGVFQNGTHLDKSGYVMVSGIYYHPSSKKGKNKEYREHVLVYEAFKNDCSVDDWIKKCKTNTVERGSYFVDSKVWAVHHKDGNKTNNRIGNLELLTHSEHSKRHGYENTKKLWNIMPNEASILSVSAAGEKDVYDIQMDGENKNFIANGVVVHNCGKTIQAIAYTHYKKFQRVLIVSPASVKYVWENELKESIGKESYVINSKTDLSKIPHDVTYWIINYDILKKHLPQLLKIKFDCIVCDEGHLIKSATAARTKAVKVLSVNSPGLIMISGTPILSRPAEFYTALSMIDPKTWNNYYYYVRRYCNAHASPFGLNVSGASHTAELHRRVSRYFIRRLKSDVLKDLPSKVFSHVPVEMSKEDKDKYSEANNNFARYLRDHAGKQSQEIAASIQAQKLAQLTELRRLCAYAKLEAAKTLIDGMVEEGVKVVVFCSFVDPLRKLQEHYGDRAVTITGEVEIADRQKAVKAFQEDPKVQVFLGGVKSAGVGITLTAASRCVFLDFSWNPSDMKQAQDRLHRIGSKFDSISIYQLYAENTIDEDMSNLLKEKQSIFDAVIDGKEAEAVESDLMKQAMVGVLLRADKMVKPITRVATP